MTRLFGILDTRSKTTSLAAVALACILISPCDAALIAHWRGNNTAEDSTPNNHDGAVGGATYVGGVVGNAFSFDGINDSVIVTASAALEPATLSVSLWVQAIPENHLRLLIDSTHGTGQAGWAVQLNSSNNISFAYGNGSSFPEITSAIGISNGEFHHVAATLDGVTMRLYVDGALTSSLAFTGVPAPSGRDIQLGNHLSLNRPLQGALDEVRIYDHALNQTEITSLSTVPEPSSAVLLGLAALSIIGMRSRCRERL